MALVRSRSRHVEALSNGATIAPDEELNVDVTGDIEVRLLDEGKLIIIDGDLEPEIPGMSTVAVVAEVPYDPTREPFVVDMREAADGQVIGADGLPADGRGVFRGAWQADTVYYARDLVTFADGLYAAIDTFTSADTFDSGDWDAVATSSSPTSGGLDLTVFDPDILLRAEDIPGDVGSTVDTWTDAVQGVIFQAPAAGNRPTKALVDGHPVIRCVDDDFLKSAASFDFTAGGYTLICVARHIATGTNGIFRLASSTADATSQGEFYWNNTVPVITAKRATSIVTSSSAGMEPTVGDLYVLTITVNGSAAVIRVNGIQKDSDAGDYLPGAATPAYIGLGYGGAGWGLNGDLGTMFVKAGVMATADIRRIEAELAVAYGIETTVPPSLHPRLVGSRVTIVDDATHNAFPGAVRLNSGKRLTVYRKSSGHSATDGKLTMRTSLDAGVSWSAETDILDTANNLLDPAVVELASGAIVVTYTDHDPTNPGGLYTALAKCIRSTDGGATWSAPITITSAFTRWSFISSPAVQLPEGRLLAAMYGIDSGQDGSHPFSRLSYSDDDGVTWAALSTIRAYDAATDWAEPNICIYENEDQDAGPYKLVCVTRTDTDVSFKTYESTDDGLTWIYLNTLTTISGRPTLAQHPDGALVLVGRDRTPVATNYAVFFSSLDGGETWSSRAPFDGGSFVYGQFIGDDLVNYGLVYALEPVYGGTDANVYYQRLGAIPAAA